MNIIFNDKIKKKKLKINTCHIDIFYEYNSSCNKNKTNLSICMEITDITIAVILSAIVALTGGRTLSVILPELNKHLDRKPFNCRPCLTFHLMWTLTALCALVTASVVLFIAGIMTAFILFFIVRYIDNKKVIK